MVFVSLRVRRDALSRAPSPTDFPVFVVARVPGNCSQECQGIVARSGDCGILTAIDVLTDILGHGSQKVQL
jgi:hypothetical protein